MKCLLNKLLAIKTLDRKIMREIIAIILKEIREINKLKINRMKINKKHKKLKIIQNNKIKIIL